MKWFLIAFCTILAYRTVFCISGYARAVYYEKKYNAYLTGKGEVFTLYAAPARKLFKQAKISTPIVPYCEPVGYGKVMTTRVYVFDNMANKRQDVVCHMMNSFAPTVKKFIGELDYYFQEAVKIEYEYYVQKERAKEEQRAIREQMRQERNAASWNASRSRSKRKKASSTTRSASCLSRWLILWTTKRQHC